MYIKRILKNTMNNAVPTNLATDEMDHFLERHNLPKFPHEEETSENSIKQMILIINKLPKRKVPGPNGFTGEFYRTFKEQKTLTLHNLFQTIKAQGRFFNSFDEGQHCPNNKTRLKTLQKRKLWIKHKSTCKVINKILAN